jgi:type IV secretory pathway TraG/TraD family ATPase VirD4
MKVIRKMFKGFGNALGYLIKGYRLNKKEGASFLKENEYSQFLSKKGKGLVLNGLDLRLSEQESFQNVLLAARVGAGKTSKYIIPNVLDKADKICSLVVNDPKGEVFEKTSGFMKAKGFNIIVFNPNEISQSHFFNPFSEAKNDTELEQLAETIIWSGNPGDRNSYWNNGASRMLSVLIKVLSVGDERFFNLPNLYKLMQNFGEDGGPLDQWVSDNGWNPKYPNDEYLQDEWRGALTGNAEAIQSFAGICITSLRSFSNRDMKAFFHKSDYSLDRLRKEKTIIYFITPPENQQYYSFAISLFFRSIFNQCMRKEHLSGSSLPVYLLFDEFGNSYVSDFVSVANTIRGYGVSLSIVLQTISQLEDKYGQATSKSILGAFNTSLCLDSSDPYTAEYFSKLAGRVREIQMKNSYSQNNIFDNETSRQEYNLLNTNEVRTIASNEVLIISKNRNPVKIEITPYFQNRRMVKKTMFPPLLIKHDRKTGYYLLKLKPISKGVK